MAVIPSATFANVSCMPIAHSPANKPISRQITAQNKAQLLARNQTKRKPKNPAAASTGAKKIISTPSKLEARSGAIMCVPYQRPRFSDPACGKRGLQPQRGGRVTCAWLANQPRRSRSNDVKSWNSTLHCILTTCLSSSSQDFIRVPLCVFGLPK